ncbi:DUF5694 domain-containing protein [Massilia sp. erpn]|uniref:DUF5694 domain-containing protein n=1 Tax=Massilia sp. erpn TaxID=2738142 RepID=UPI0021068FE8|nr:DUF5694 domain-containing protein [Massilia sp. erpn]UTY59725.1 hypothetical protein HPQ68_22635 [Massilia sp. erpn]
MFERLTLLCLTMTLFAASASAEAATESFDPSTLKVPPKGKPNEVLVLGTAHLAQLPATFQPASLNALLDKLISWKPKIIVIESLSGPECAVMRQYPRRYEGTAQRYCRWDPSPAQAATGLDVPAATAEIDKLLENWPAAPTPSQRRRLAALFLAGGEPVSALVQWLRLPEAERHAGDGLDDRLAAILDQRQFGRGPRGEDTLLAAPLAAALGHERVIPMDDHSISDVPLTQLDGYDKALAKAWENPAFAKRQKEYESLSAGIDKPEKTLALYRALNQPSSVKLVYESDFGAMLDEPSPQQFGRLYVATWERRNLRMASNIREAMGNHPGSRALVIVGYSHKGYLEAYLNQMHDVRIVPAGPVLE